MAFIRFADDIVTGSQDYSEYINSNSKSSSDAKIAFDSRCRGVMCSTPATFDLNSTTCSSVADSEIAVNFADSDSPGDSFETSFGKILIEIGKLQQNGVERDNIIRELAKFDSGYRNCDDSKDVLLKSLLDKWEKVDQKTDDLEKLWEIQKEIVNIRDKLRNIAYKIPNMTTVNLVDKVELENNICILKGELCDLKEKKSLITKCNISMYNLTSTSKFTLPSLKDDITELYHIWEETYQKVSQQLGTLQQILLMWQRFDDYFRDLNDTLKGDHKTLNALNSVLEHGMFVPNIKSMQDTDKTGPKQEDVLKINADIPITVDTFIGNYCNPNGTHTPISIEGSLSDSGISDSGSEQDLTERERRLATLKKLARHLESMLTPGSAALANIMKKVNETEVELRDLQQTCKDLIAKTSPADVNCPVSKKNMDLYKNKVDKNVADATMSKGKKDKAKRRPLLWRIIRAALPFHMAIVVLVCIACLLEPHCCDSLNTFNLSFLPQLRYISGPPPT